MKLIIYIFLFSLAIHPQIKNIKISSPKIDYLIGDTLNISLLVKHSTNFIFKGTNLSSSYPSLEVKDSIIQGMNDTTTFISYKLTSFDSLKINMNFIGIYFANNDSVDIEYHTLSSTFNILINYANVDLTKDIKDIKSPIKDGSSGYIILLGIFLLIIFLLIFFSIKNKTKANSNKEEIVLTPEDKAYTALDSVLNTNLWESGKVKEFHFSISFIFKTYIAEVFNESLQEKTSIEIVNYLKQTISNNHIINLVENFLINIDLVKYSKFIPKNEIKDEVIIQLRDIITSISENKKDVNASHN